MFQDLLSSRSLDTQTPTLSSRASTASTNSQANIARTAASLPLDTKWQMVESDARARWEAAQDLKRKEEDTPRIKGKRATTSTAMKSSPEWFITKIMDDSITVQHLTMLEVSLRTLPVE